MATSRDDSLDFIKGVLIYLVVLGHSIQFGLYGNQGGCWNDPIFSAIYLFHMPAFIAISGYLVANKIDAKLSLTGFVQKRILPVLVPLLTWSLLLGLLKTAFISVKLRTFSPFGAGVILLDVIASSYWFLWAILFGSSCAWIASRFGRVWIAITIALAVLFLLLPLEEIWGGISPQVRLTVPFYLGAYSLSRCGFAFRSIGLIPAVLLLGVAIAAWCGWNKDTYIYNNHLAYWCSDQQLNIVRMLIGTLAATAAFLRLMIAIYDRICDWKIVSLLTLLGGATLEIYLVQTVYFRVHQSIPKHVMQLFPNYAACVVDVSLAIAISLIAYRLTSKSRILKAVLWGGFQNEKREQRQDRQSQPDAQARRF